MDWNMDWIEDFFVDGRTRDYLRSMKSMRLRLGTARRRSNALKKRIETLEKDNDLLHLYLDTLLQYLADRGIVEDEQFSALFESIAVIEKKAERAEETEGAVLDVPDDLLSKMDVGIDDDEQDE